MKRLLVMLTLFVCQLAIADEQSITCITNNKDIAVGQTVEQVIKTCGKPAKQITHDVTTSKDKQVTEWYYLFQLDNELVANSKPIYILAKLEIDFYQHKVDHVHIYVSNKNPQVVNALNLLGYVVEEGATEDQVTSIFGQPIKTAQNTLTEDNKETVIDGLLYSDSESKQDQTINFDQDQLTTSEVKAQPAKDSKDDTKSQ